MQFYSVLHPDYYPIAFYLSAMYTNVQKQNMIFYYEPTTAFWSVRTFATSYLSTSYLFGQFVPSVFWSVRTILVTSYLFWSVRTFHIFCHFIQNIYIQDILDSVLLWLLIFVHIKICFKALQYCWMHSRIVAIARFRIKMIIKSIFPSSKFLAISRYLRYIYTK